HSKPWRKSGDGKRRSRAFQSSRPVISRTTTAASCDSRSTSRRGRSSAPTVTFGLANRMPRDGGRRSRVDRELVTAVKRLEDGARVEDFAEFGIVVGHD